MTIRAKFTVQSITRERTYRDHKETYAIKMRPVIGDSEENKRFFAATPGGAVELLVVNPEAGAAFELGADYYLDFTKADQA